MSANPANLAAKGQAALSAQNYTEAIEHYTAALEAIPTSVDYYIKRSTANQRALKYQDALHDADLAVYLAHKRGARELIGTAQLRRGITLLLLEQYGDAGVCFKKAEEFNSSEKSIAFWVKKLQMQLDKVDEDDFRREVTIKEIPDVVVPKPVKKVATAGGQTGTQAGSSTETPRIEELPDDHDETKMMVGDDVNGWKSVSSRNQAKKTTTTDNKDTATPTQPPAPVPEGVTTPANKIRHEWYQSSNSVVVSLIVKGVQRDKLTVDFQPQSLSVAFPLPSGSDFTFDLDPLCHPIDSTASTYKVLSTKVEFTLVKSESGRKWAALESAVASTTTASTSSTTATGTSTTTNSNPTGPAYPTSSKSGPKNWDKLVDDLKSQSKAKSKSTKKPDATAGTADNSNTTTDATTNASSTDNDGNNDDEDDIDYGDIDEDEFGNDPVNGFFKKLFKDADPDTRRAMMKSYTESNGTALSTNWSEVGKGKVETSPPEGMIAKQWGA